MTDGPEPTEYETIADLIGSHMGAGINALARKMAGEDAAENDVKRHRRNLQRWRTGTVPQRKQWPALSDALGVELQRVADAAHDPAKAAAEAHDRLAALEQEVAELRREVLAVRRHQLAESKQSEQNTIPSRLR